MKGRKFLPAAIGLIILLALSVGLGQAQGPAPSGAGQPQVLVDNTFTYQGELQKDGAPINATCVMTFTLYDDPAAGAQVGTPLGESVSVVDGLFTVQLDFGGGIFTGDARWLEIAVQCPGDAGSSTLSPRQEMTAAPYALSLQPGAHVEGGITGGDVLTLINEATTSSSYGLHAIADSTAGIGVFGQARSTMGSTYGVFGQSDSTAGVGVRGYASANSGTTYGVAGRVDSPDGQAVRGLAAATTGSAYGVYGESGGTAGIGVRGWGTNTTGINYGVHGQTASTEGRGVCGFATAASGDAWGVYGRSNSTDGRGVYGNAAAASGYASGVYGATFSPNGSGVWGTTEAAGCGQCIGVGGSSDGGRGVYGATETGVGVYAYANSLSGTALKAEAQIDGGGNLIEAWHGPMFADRKFYVSKTGNVYADGAYLNPASGFAEMLPGAAGLEAGDVLVVGPDGNLARCDAAYQPTVVGVYAPQAGYVGGAVEDATGQVPLAVVGVVKVKVSAENGPIRAGDLLVASATPGHAMRAGDDPALGTVIGKALGSLDKDTGTILMLVMLR